MSDPLLRLPDVQEETKISRASIYRQIKAGTFPKPRRIGPRMVAWRTSEIEAWKQSRPAFDADPHN